MGQTPEEILNHSESCHRSIQEAAEVRRATRVARFSLFIKIALVCTVGYTVYAHVLGYPLLIALNWVNVVGYGASAVAFFRHGNYKLASSLYISFGAFAIFSAALYTGQAYSEVLWTAPIIPAAAAYLQGRKAAIRYAIACTMIIVVVHATQPFVVLP